MATRGGPVLHTDMLPPSLPKALEELLKAAEAGAIPPDANPANAAQLRDLLAQLGALQDPKLLKALAEAMAANPGLTADQIAQKMKALAERAKHAADMSMTRPDVRAALEALSKDLSKAAESEPSKNGEEPSDAAASKDSSPGESGKTDAGKDAEDASLQFSKDAGAGSGIGVLMTSSDAPPMGDLMPGLGMGGSSSDRKGGGKMADLEQALRKGTLRASADTAGDDVITSRAAPETPPRNAHKLFSPAAAPPTGGAAAPPRAPPRGGAGVVRIFFTNKKKTPPHPAASPSHRSVPRAFRPHHPGSRTPHRRSRRSREPARSRASSPAATSCSRAFRASARRAWSTRSPTCCT